MKNRTSYYVDISMPLQINNIWKVSFKNKYSRIFNDSTLSLSYGISAQIIKYS